MTQIQAKVNTEIGQASRNVVECNQVKIKNKMKINTKQKISYEFLEIFEDNMWFLTALVTTFSAIAMIWLLAQVTLSVLN